ncbi:MAG: DUF2071 domain-containing protein [Putridiphycobacter sp.]
MSFLKLHPFGVKAFFKKSVVLTFAIPKEELETFIPNHLTLDTFEDKWAFIAIAMVDTKALRPKWFPKFMGNDFYLIGYRIFVRYKSKAGKNLRGLYILKSETNRKKMAVLGRIFTQYNYSTTDITEIKTPSGSVFKSQQSNFKFEIENHSHELPQNSPFKNWETARKFSGPLPHTFTYLENKKSMLIIRGLRQNWKPEPIQVLNYQFEFLNNLNLSQVQLASAFQIKDVPYEWEKGKLETWT